MYLSITNVFNITYQILIILKILAFCSKIAIPMLYKSTKNKKSDSEMLAKLKFYKWHYEVKFCTQKAIELKKSNSEMLAKLKSYKWHYEVKFGIQKVNKLNQYL